MSGQDKITLTGVVQDVTNSILKVEIMFGDQSKLISCYPSGKIRTNSILIIKGDRVDVELSPYDLTRGRVVYRHRD